MRELPVPFPIAVAAPRVVAESAEVLHPPATFQRRIFLHDPDPIVEVREVVRKLIP